MSYIHQLRLPDPYPAGVQASHCANPNACKMRVEGQGSVMLQPDTASVILGVTTENMQLKTAQEENAVKTANVINTLRRMGVPAEDIQTQSYIIEPKYDYADGQQAFKGYRVVHSLKVTIRNIGRVGEIIDAAVASGANTVNSIAFTVQNPAQYYSMALQKAIDDAAGKALTIGKKLNLSVSRVPVQIMEETYEPVPPGQPVMMLAVQAATPIQAGQIEITAKIQAVFAYTPGYQGMP